MTNSDPDRRDLHFFGNTHTLSLIIRKGKKCALRTVCMENCEKYWPIHSSGLSHALIRLDYVRQNSIYGT